MPENLYRRGKIWWGRIQFDKQELRKSLRTTRKAKAREKFDAWKDELEDARAYGHNRMTWGDAVGRYCLEVMPGAIKPSTGKRYLVSFGAVKASLDGKFVDTIGRKDIASLVSARKRDRVTNATIGRDLTAVSRVLASAIGWGAAEHNAAREYDRSLVRERRDPIDLPTPEEVQEAIQGAKSFGRLMLLASQTGMRQGELVGLQWRQVELNRGVVTLSRTKTDLARAIPLEGPLLGDALRTLSGTPRHATKSLVFWHGDGEAYKNFAANFREWRRRKGVRFRFHDLRHYFAVMYLRGGGYIYDLQAILGHASIKTTEGYLKYLTPEQKRQAMRLGGTNPGTGVGGFPDSPQGPTGV